MHNKTILLITIYTLAALTTFSRAQHIPQPAYLTASYYSVSSLHKDGQWKLTKGIMSNGKLFNENDYTCATRFFPCGSILHIKNLSNGKSVIVKVTDKIGKRSAKTRIDLSRAAFARIANLRQGIVKVKVEVSND